MGFSKRTLKCSQTQTHLYNSLEILPVPEYNGCFVPIFVRKETQRIQSWIKSSRISYTVNRFPIAFQMPNWTDNKSAGKEQNPMCWKRAKYLQCIVWNGIKITIEKESKADSIRPRLIRPCCFLFLWMHKHENNGTGDGWWSIKAAFTHAFTHVHKRAHTSGILLQLRWDGWVTFGTFGPQQQQRSYNNNSNNNKKSKTATTTTTRKKQSKNTNNGRLFRST